MALLITFAHPQEAAPTIKRLGEEFDGGRIVVTGMGKWHYSTDGVTEIWNFGIAGALTDELEIGSLHRIGTASNGTNTLFLHERGKRLYTSATPVWDLDKRNQLGQHYDIVDMEGYGIALHAGKIPVLMWKLISDHAKPDQQPQLKQRLTPLAKQLANEIEQLVRQRNR